MSMETIKADTIEQYDRFFGFQTRHPSVAVVHFDRSEIQPAYKMTFGFYALFLKKTVGCTINYGKTKYDYDDETVVSFAPGQTVGIHRIEDGPVPEAVGLLFHPDFLHRTPLAPEISSIVILPETHFLNHGNRFDFETSFLRVENRDLQFLHFNL